LAWHSKEVGSARGCSTLRVRWSVALRRGVTRQRSDIGSMALRVEPMAQKLEEVGNGEEKVFLASTWRGAGDKDDKGGAHVGGG
jgi:hypothetical protein